MNNNQPVLGNDILNFVENSEKKISQTDHKFNFKYIY
jgi:hypothetical protein